MTASQDMSALMDDKRQIIELFEDGDRALMAADAAEMMRVYADDYVQQDGSGKTFTREEVIRNLTLGMIRFVSMTSTGRHVRFLRDDIAIVQGSEEDVVEQGGKRLTIRYVYMDVVEKRDGRWQIVASQLSKPGR
jgi:uncharacterized protein (TIGR02246 family)